MGGLARWVCGSDWGLVAHNSGLPVNCFRLYSFDVAAVVLKNMLVCLSSEDFRLSEHNYTWAEHFSHI